MQLGIPYTQKVQLRHFQEVIFVDLHGVITSMTIHREPTKETKGFVSIAFETSFDVHTLRTLLGRLGTTFELFDENGGQIKTMRRPRRSHKTKPLVK